MPLSVPTAASRDRDPVSVIVSSPCYPWDEGRSGQAETAHVQERFHKTGGDARFRGRV